MLEEKYDLTTITLVIPQYYPDFVWDSLSYFSFKKIIKTKPEELIVAPQCVFVSNPEYGSCPNLELTQKIRNRFSPINANEGQGHEKIYISRKNASRRKIVNESEVIILLSSVGFKVVEMEDLNFKEQVSLMNTTKILISIHGAGLSNMNFLPEGGTVVEFFKRLQPNNYLNKSYWRLANACSLSYYTQWCEAEDAEASFDESNLIVDIQELKATLELIEKGKA